METTALVLAYVGVALMVGLAGVASSIGTAITGQAAVGAMTVSYTHLTLPTIA